jgi:hypothetical protein
MKMRWIIIPSAIIAIILVLFLCHLTPKWALRAHLFTAGYFISSFTTGIVDDGFHNRLDKKMLAIQIAKYYTLTIPPVELSTKGILANWKVKKVGIFYYDSYFGYS